MLLVTVLATLVTFAIFLFFGILLMATLNLIRGGGMSMAYAYRYVAAPVAALALVIALVIAIRNEIFDYRQARAADSQGRSLVA